jgi:hypothetical protein
MSLAICSCGICNPHVYGHAVYLDGQLLCTWCSLDMVVSVNAKEKETKE